MDPVSIFGQNELSSDTFRIRHVIHTIIPVVAHTCKRYKYQIAGSSSLCKNLSHLMHSSSAPWFINGIRNFYLRKMNSRRFVMNKLQRWN